jgi:hypothetical protein
VRDKYWFHFHRPNEHQKAATILRTMLSFLALFLVIAAAAAAENPIGTRVDFNKELGDNTCLDSEWKLVQSAIVNATLTRRQRRLGEAERELSRHLGKCLKCGVFCHMIGCPPPKGRRLHQ